MTSFRDLQFAAGVFVALVVVPVCCAEYAESIRDAVAAAGDSASRGPEKSNVSISRLAWSSDGRKLLSLRFGDVGPFGPLVVHDVEHESEILSVDLGDEVAMDVALAPDARHVLVGTALGKLWWIGLDSEQRVALLVLPVRQTIVAVAVAPNGQSVSAIDIDGNVYLCDPHLESWSKLNSGLSSPGTKVRFSACGQRLAAAATDGTVAVWNAQSGALLRRFSGREPCMIAVDFLEDLDRIVGASFNAALYVWGTSAGCEILRKDLVQSSIRSLAISSDGRTAARGGTDREIVVWDVETGIETLKIQTTLSPIRSLAFSPDGRYLAAAGRDSAIFIFETATGAQHRQIELGLELPL
jgi:WD40 repeat protein